MSSAISRLIAVRALHRHRESVRAISARGPTVDPSFNTDIFDSPTTYTNKFCEWLVITMKDNKL